jgi:SH3-like domain-containing protein
MCLALPVMAQTQPSSGVLQLPSKTAAPTAPSAPAAPVAAPKPAPRAPVQQVAPFTSAPLTGSSLTGSALGHSAPGKPPPVVQPKGDTHAQKPSGKPPAKPTQTAKPAAPAKPGTDGKAPEKTPSKPGVAAVGAAVVGGAAVGAAAGIAAGSVAAAPAAPAEPEKPAPDPAKGTATTLPLPRWASLRSDEVNLRTGPGTRYPIDWIYRRRDLPVEIEREYEVWRLVRDQDGIKGWVHQATLVGRRSFVVTGGDRTLRKSASDDAAAVAVLKPGVVGRIRACEAGKTWCELQVADYRGWLKRDEIWGLFPNEAVN